MAKKQTASFLASREHQKGVLLVPVHEVKARAFFSGPIPDGPVVSHAAEADPDDAPEWTDEQLDRAEFAIGGKVVRPAIGTLTRGPGRPKLANPKEHVSVRLDPDVLAALKASGPGWQGRMNDALRTALGLNGARETLTLLLAQFFTEQPEMIPVFGFDDPETTVAQAVEGVFVEGSARRPRATETDVRGTARRLRAAFEGVEGETAARIRAMLEPLTH